MNWAISSWSLDDRRSKRNKLTVAEEFKLLGAYLFDGKNRTMLAGEFNISEFTVSQILEYYFEAYLYRRYGGPGKPVRPQELGPTPPFRILP